MVHNNNESSAVKILHLYKDLMNLYGDWANPAILARELEARGYAAKIDCVSVGDRMDFGAYDFIYIGSGTERSLNACLRDLKRCSDALLGCIEDGARVLATGNSHELFGRAVTEADGKRFETLGLLDFETRRQDTRVTGDCVVKADFLQDKLVGFINRAGGGQEGGVERPFLAELGPDAGKTPDAVETPGAGKKPGAGETPGAEGIKYKNLLGTYMTGPVLVRNPPLLKYIADQLRPGSERVQAGGDPLFGYQEAAYRMALSELSARIGAQST